MATLNISDIYEQFLKVLERYKRLKEESSVCGEILNNQDDISNPYYPTYLRITLAPAEDKSGRFVRVEFLCMALTSINNPNYLYNERFACIDDLNDLSTGISRFRSFLNYSENSNVAMFFDEKELLISNNETFVRPSNADILEIANRVQKEIEDNKCKKIVAEDKPTIKLTKDEIETIVDEIVGDADNKMIDVKNATYQAKEAGIHGIHGESNIQSVFNRIALGVGATSLIFCAGIAVGLAIPFVGVAQLVKKLLRK